MKKLSILLALSFVMTLQNVYAGDSVFDSMDSATEVKLAPAITSTTTAKETKVNAVYQSTNSSIKEQKFNSALVNLDDAQVELRQELATTTAKYNDALNEKKKAIQNCKNIKKEINEINKKMRNVEKSKKIINKNLQTAQ